MELRATLNKSVARGTTSLPGAVCGVANARDSYGYRFGLRLSSHPHAGRAASRGLIQRCLGQRSAGRLGAVAGLLLTFCGLVAAQPIAPAERAIRRALTDWMADFNAARTDRVCKLFAPTLRYDYRGFAERNYQQLCDGLHESLADPTRRYNYALDIKDIMVSGDLAVARVVWTLTVTPRDTPSKSTVSQEYSMDVLRRQPDGGWKMTRFTAYEKP